MSDNKLISNEINETDTFLGRLSVVVLSIALFVSLAANLGLSHPSPEIKILGYSPDKLFAFSCFGWLAYLIIIYLSGRYSEVQAKCVKTFGNKLEENFLFWTVPVPVGCIFYCVAGLLWRLPDFIHWVFVLIRS